VLALCRSELVGTDEWYKWYRLVSKLVWFPDDLRGVGQCLWRALLSISMLTPLKVHEMSSEVRQAFSDDLKRIKAAETCTCICCFDDLRDCIASRRIPEQLDGWQVRGVGRCSALRGSA
jgi:hypothetical protein